MRVAGYRLVWGRVGCWSTTQTLFISIQLRHSLKVMSDTATETSQRPRLNLKPRDPNLAKQLELQRTASGKVSRLAPSPCRDRCKLLKYSISDLQYVNGYAYVAYTLAEVSLAACISQPGQQQTPLTLLMQSHVAHILCRILSAMQSHGRQFWLLAQAKVKQRSSQKR